MATKIKNPLFELDKKRLKVSLQEQDGDKVEAKKRGRPAKPNMVRFVIKMDETLKNNLAQYARTQGVPMSSVISIAIRRLLSDSKDNL